MFWTLSVSTVYWRWSPGAGAVELELPNCDQSQNLHQQESFHCLHFSLDKHERDFMVTRKQERISNAQYVIFSEKNIFFWNRWTKCSEMALKNRQILIL